MKELAIFLSRDEIFLIRDVFEVIDEGLRETGAFRDVHVPMSFNQDEIRTVRRLLNNKLPTCYSRRGPEAGKTKKNKFRKKHYKR